MSKRTFSPAFKREAASLVLDQGYSVAQACEAVDVGQTAMRRWIEQLQGEREGRTLSGARALTTEHQRIQELEARLRKVERERYVKGSDPFDLRLIVL